MVATVKESSAEIWARLPAPVQQHGPIIGAVLLTAFVVHRIDKGRLRTEVKNVYRSQILAFGALLGTCEEHQPGGRRHYAVVCPGFTS